MSALNPYAVLGVPCSATTLQIKMRYRFLCHAYHPDKFGQAEHKATAEGEFRRINEAYVLLCDAEMRRQYDTSHSSFESEPICQSSQKSKATENSDTFVPFSDVCGLVPGVSTLHEVIQIFGKPEHSDISHKVESCGIQFGGNPYLRYPSRGVNVLMTIRQTEDANEIISRINVEAPFRAVTPQGLYIGMVKSKAVAILERHFVLRRDYGESKDYSMYCGAKQGLQVWFSNNTLIRMSLP